MPSEVLNLSVARRLRALRELDVFHPWNSIDERRFCRRCGQPITGRQILVCSGSRDRRPARLECPTGGCLAVPLDWIIPDEAANESLAADLARSVPVPKRMENTRYSFSHRLFGFLRAPQTFH
ncbi:MAG: hypothetical protein M3Q46_04210 [Verrucomicrobiota bacterium]|nr:hypothetical protein [Verrucomicrobiota bacterium]